MGGPARMHPTTFVAPGAVVVGDVTLGAGVGVWFNTVVRADSAPVELGELSNLQDNTVVHEDEGLPTRIGARVTVGHRSIIHGCVIEDECLIGMGSVVLSGARIGTGSLIGAAALVREGQVIPPGSLVVGAPARVLGPVSDGHRAAIANGWTQYAELARDYMSRGHIRSLDRSGALIHDRGPMDEAEWWSSLERFGRLPNRLADAQTHGWPGVPDAAGIVSFLAARDRLQREPLLARLAAGEEAAMDPRPNPEGAASGRGTPEWGETRRHITEVLARLGPRWSARALHPTRGTFALTDLVRDWIDEDLEHMESLGAVTGRER